jgi:hypothetical protein
MPPNDTSTEQPRNRVGLYDERGNQRESRRAIHLAGFGVSDRFGGRSGLGAGIIVFPDGSGRWPFRGPDGPADRVNAKCATRPIRREPAPTYQTSHDDILGQHHSFAKLGSPWVATLLRLSRRLNRKHLAMR